MCVFRSASGPFDAMQTIPVQSLSPRDLRCVGQISQNRSPHIIFSLHLTVGFWRIRYSAQAWACKPGSSISA